MNTSISKKIIASVLTLAMVCSFIPSFSFLQNTEVEALPIETSTKDKSDVFVYVEGKTGSTAGLRQVVDGATAEFKTSMWHYSGGYWGGNLERLVYDHEFRKTIGGVANIEDTLEAGGLVYGTQDFDYYISKTSELHKALENGEDIYIEIAPSSNNKDVTLEKLFSFPTMKDSEGYNVFKTNANGSLMGLDKNNKETDNIAKVVKEGEQWKIVFSLPLKLNYYWEDTLSFRDFGLGLEKYIPIPKLGYGHIMFSIFPRYKGGIQNNGDLPAYFWFGDENGNDFNSWKTNISQTPVGKIHPQMILPTGQPFGGSSGYLKDGYKIKLIRDNGIMVDSSQYKIGIDTLVNAGAVGLSFNYGLKLNIYAKPKAKVIASYVKVESVDDHGNPIYQTLKESEYYTDFKTDGKYVFIDSSVVVDVNGDAQRGVLNDVISSPKDLGEPQNISWSEGYTPKNSAVQLKTNAEDISHYRFGIVTKDETCVSSVLTQQSHVDIKSLNQAQRLALFLSAVRGKSSIPATYVGLSSSTISMSQVGLKEAHELSDPLTVPISSPLIDSLSAENKKSGNNLSDTEVNYFVTNKKEKAEDIATPGTIDDTNSSESNVVYLRYIVYPETVQRNRIHINVDGKEVGILVQENTVGIDNDDGIKADIYFKDLTPDLSKLGDIVTLNKWITSEEKIKDLISNPIPSSGTQSGTTVPNIISSVPKTEDVFADWTIEIFVKEDKPVLANVEQWRLSKYSPQYEEWKVAGMWLSLGSDSGHKTSTLSPSGKYNYSPVNPNEKVALPDNTPENQKLHGWLHSKALTRGSYSISHDDVLKAVEMNGTLNLIKSTEDSGLTSAKWVENDATMSGLLKYNVQNGFIPNSNVKGANYDYDLDLDYGLLNKDTYTHGRGVYYHYHCGGKHCRGHCGCYLSYETAPANYLDAIYNLRVNFDRYVQQNTDSKKLVIQPETKSENGFTTIKYQQNTTLNVYPEYGMLFANDAGEESIKWVVGDQSRKISPIVYQTLEHKVYVEAQSNGNVATDSRATVAANKIGESNKQVLYKGGPVNTLFKVQRSEDKKSSGILTVKTFALDFNNKANVKNAWGNGSYNTLNVHKSLISSINSSNKAKATEKLLVDSPSYNSVDYTGAVKSLTTGSYNVIKYKNALDGGTITEFTHELIVRGGAVIGVRLQDRSSGNYNLVSITELKTKDEALYNALVGMNLYNSSLDRSKTVFSTFEHLTGAKLTENKYAEELAKARNFVDKMATPTSSTVSANNGWYSEDTTVLVIKEYVTNYDVPSINFGDKLSMSVKGLDTPINKNEFFNKLGKGYTYLKYDLPIISGNNKDVKTNAYFEFSSFSGDNLGFGQQKVDYLVPNVGVSDTTRLN